MDSAETIYVDTPVLNDNRWIISFRVPERIRKFFIEDHYWFECSEAVDVPEAIAVVPAVAMLLPVAWVFDLKLSVKALDQPFFESIDSIKSAYCEMLPLLTLGGSIHADTLVASPAKASKNSSLALFSGGVDAWCTLVRHLSEHPRLVTVWGSDIAPDNNEGWEIVKAHSVSAAQTLNCDFSQIRSNFKVLLNWRALDAWLMEAGTPYLWWHDVQHGIGLLSLVSPIAYVYGASRTYIASTYYEGDKGKYTCASDPTIDNMFVAGPMRGCHDGYELTRQAKIETIVEYVRATGVKIGLHVCFHVQTGDNCCLCEKCGRTILGIYSAGSDPHDFGFSYSASQLKLLALRMRYFYRMEIEYYRYIAQSAQKNKGNIPSCMSWILSSNLEHVCDNAFKRGWARFHNFGARIYHSIVK